MIVYIDFGSLQYKINKYICRFVFNKKQVKKKEIRCLCKLLLTSMDLESEKNNIYLFIIICEKQ